MISARGHGLHTCPQAAFADYHRIIRAHLGIPEGHTVICGLSIGYEEDRDRVLLEIEELDAIEWTPQAGIEGGGHPRWYDLYRRIKAAGKSVQAIGVKLDEIEPLIEAVGPEGLYILCWHDKEAEARALLRRCGWRGAV